MSEFQLLLSRIRNGMTTQDDEKYVNALVIKVLDMKHALDFYATQTNYFPFDKAGHTPIELDGGEKAQKALGL